MTKIFLILVLIFTAIEVNTQVLQQWANRFSTSGYKNDEGYFIEKDASGNIYTSGYLNDTRSDIIIIKYNSQGDTLWTYRYIGPYNSTKYLITMSVSASGDVYIGGDLFSPSQSGFLIFKINSNGTFGWQDYLNPISRCTKIVIDNVGNVIACGTNFVDGLIRKYSSTGTLLATQTVNVSYSDEIDAVFIDANNNLYVTGISRPGPQPPTLILTAKFNSGLTLLWQQTFGLSNYVDFNSGAKSISVDNTGNVYMICSVNLNSNSTNGDLALVKYNSSGIQQWYRIYNHNNQLEFTKALECDKIGNIFVTCESRSSNSKIDVATLKYNANGDTMWVKRYNSSDSTDQPSDLMLDRYGDVYVAVSTFLNTNRNKYHIIKYSNSTGNVEWIKEYSGTVDSNDYSGRIFLDTNTNVYFTGSSSGNNTGLDIISGKLIQKPNFSSALTVLAVSQSRINLTWLDTNRNETGFKIEHSTNGGSNWFLKDSVMANITSYSDTGLTPSTIYHYRVFAYNQAGVSPYSNVSFDTTLSLTSITQTGTEIPEVFKLYNNYPNPFNPVTKIKFDIPAVSGNSVPVKIAVYNLLGEEVTLLADKQMQPGRYEVNFDASMYSTGVYFYRIKAGEFTDVKKMILVK